MPTQDVDRASLEEEILQQKLVLCKLYTRRNSLSPVSRLPNELLESIFILYAASYYESREFPSVYTPPWINVSYVCTHWRNVALDCPVLWSYIFTLSQYWTEVLLARSEQVPLKIRIKVLQDNSLWWTKFVEKLMNHAERIEELRVFIYWWNKRAHRIFARLFSGVSRSLQHLEFSMESVSFGESFSRRNPAPWHSYRHLNSLKILSVTLIPQSIQQGTAKFLSMLRGMQNLAELEVHVALHSARDFISSVEFNTFQKVNLPRLSRLSISAALSTIIAFFSCVNFPARTRTKLSCYHEDDHGSNSSLDDHSRFCSVLARKYDREWVHSFSAIRSMSIGLVANRALLVFSSKCSVDSLATSLARDILLVIIFEFKSPWSSLVIDSESDEHNATLLSNMFSSIPVTSVQNLHVSDPPFHPVFWRRILRHLPELRWIKINEYFSSKVDSSGMLARFACELREGNSSGHVTGNQSSDRRLTPRLKKLVLSDIRLTGDELNLLRVLSNRLEPPFQVSLVNCVTDGASCTINLG